MKNNNKNNNIVEKNASDVKDVKIVVFGGGTGLSVLLSGLRKYTVNVTAIVTVADDGGSSGRLRGELGILPPGDIRDCLVALADRGSLLEDLLQYRFSCGELAGHSLGNLLLAALTDITGGFDKAVEALGEVLAVKGRVLPSTLENVVLIAEMTDGTVVCGQSSIPRYRGRIKRVFLKPPGAAPLPEAVAAIREADAVVLGPGSLFTSIIPNLLVGGISRAVAESSALKIYVCNVMTQPGETDGYTAADHTRAIIEYIGVKPDVALINNIKPHHKLAGIYRVPGSEPVAVDIQEVKKLGVIPVEKDLLSASNIMCHNSQKLAGAIMELLNNQNRNN